MPKRFNISVGGGEAPPPGEVALIEDTFAGLTVQNPISLADLRTALASPTLGENLTMRNRIQVSNIGGQYGKALTITLPNSDSGVVYQPLLPESFEEGYVEYDFRYRAGFGWGGGGKMPGLAGKCPEIGGNPPSGNNPSRYGWGGRNMWLKDSFGGNPVSGIEWLGYFYWPTQTFPNSYGANLHTNVSLGTQGGVSDGAWHHGKNYYKMNDTNVSNTAVDPLTLVQGTDYQANGIWRIYVDGAGSPQHESTNNVFRLYQSGKITHMQFSCFYGGDSTWADGGGLIDIANLRVVKIA